MMGNNVVVLNSMQAASDLLDKRSALYSDRACPPMLGDSTLLNWAGFPTFVHYGDVWRMYRRMMNIWMNARSSVCFHQSQLYQTQLLLGRLLNAPNTTQSSKVLECEFSRTMAATIFQSTYGYRVTRNDDKFIVGAKKSIEHMCKAMMSSNFFVNYFPALVNVPSWFPGAGWKQTALEWRKQKDWIVDTAYQWTKDQIAGGYAEPSMLRSLMEDKLTADWSQQEKDDRLKELAIALYAGGTDTTASSLVSFIAAMVLFPEVQAKAQQEIDSVIGLERLPNFTDRDQLPYISNVIKEVLRWQPVLPTGVPHVSLDEDEYRGYRIPKGTVVIGNIWAMSRDETYYKDPETFNPDRYLDPKVPALPSFGWGRRKCPGTHYAEASLFIAITSMLATFKFSKAKNANGDEITPVIEGAANAAIYVPKAFDCVWECRSETHRLLILESL
ncbi:cytochrome P450 [Ceratobasidium sp. AG-I]|nr:cytochrome P450 [Ceratobasidium sp. AG-I]